jgi:Rrf2 family transcriptional regulator, cysteine metabolism repressor
VTPDRRQPGCSPAGERARTLVRSASGATAMKVNTRVRYGLRAILQIAEQYGGEPVPISAIAESQEISGKYLEQVVGALRRAGLIVSRKGVRGGYTLGRAPGEITLWDVISALDAHTAPVDCVPEPQTCERSDGCLTRSIWTAARPAPEGVLDGASRWPTWSAPCATRDSSISSSWTPAGRPGSAELNRALRLAAWRREPPCAESRRARAVAAHGRNIMDFTASLRARAAGLRKTIVLPECMLDDRTLKAAARIRDEGFAGVVVLGAEPEVARRPRPWGWTRPASKVIDPARSTYRQEFNREYFELRRHKGMTEEEAARRPRGSPLLRRHDGGPRPRRRHGRRRRQLAPATCCARASRSSAPRPAPRSSRAAS